MGNCGSEDAVEVTDSTLNSNKPVSRPPTGRIEPTTTTTNAVKNENKNSKSERPVSPKDDILSTTQTNAKELVDDKLHSSQSSQVQKTVNDLSNGNFKNAHDTIETVNSRKGSAVSQKSQKDQSRAPSAQPLWMNPPTLPADSTNGTQQQ